MEKFKNKYRIQSSRLKNWDYASAGFYYVTLCTRDRIDYFGNIIRRDALYGVSLSEIGKIAEKTWQKIPCQFSSIELDEYVIMPNHIHGIIVINNTGGISLARIIKWFKGRVSYEIRKTGCAFSWQSRFYDHIIRNERSLNRVRKYIRDNPAREDNGEENAGDIVNIID